jgi:hypothetical protein
VSVKVFHGDRKVFKFKVSILDPIQTVMDLLEKEEPSEMEQYYESRLIYPMGSLKNLN